MRAFIVTIIMALACASTTGLAQGVDGTDMPGGDFSNFSAGTPSICFNSCAGEPRCKAWAWVKATRRCFLKDRISNVVHNACCRAGQIDQFSKDDMRQEPSTDRPGSDIRNFQAASASECERACSGEHVCSSWSFVRPAKQGERGKCFLKNRVAHPVDNKDVMSGVKFRPRNLVDDS